MIGFCVFVCLSSLFLFEGNLTLINCVWRAHLYVFLPACTVYDCVCVFTCVCGCGCFWSGGEMCWQVVCQEGDSGAFETDTRDESQGEGERKRASFMWLCIPPRHRQGEAQDETCVPPRHSLCLFPTTPALPSTPPHPASIPPFSQRP